VVINIAFLKIDELESKSKSLDKNTNLVSVTPELPAFAFTDSLEHPRIAKKLIFSYSLFLC
jgi:hypothetical protein